jgi:hypothetical protein
MVIRKAGLVNIDVSILLKFMPISFRGRRAIATEGRRIRRGMRIETVGLVHLVG